MWTLGIDVGKQRHVATLLDAQGQTVFRNYGFAQSRDGVEGLLGRLAEAEVPSGAKVAGPPPRPRARSSSTPSGPRCQRASGPGRPRRPGARCGRVLP